MKEITHCGSFFFFRKGRHTCKVCLKQTLSTCGLLQKSGFSRPLTGCLNPDLVTELPTAIFSHVICHPQLQMQRSRHASDKAPHKHSEKAITLIWPTKERETAHIQWLCRHPGIASCSCTAVLHTWKKRIQLPNISFSSSFCTALFRFLQTTALHSIAAACPRSSAVVTQPGSMDFKCLFHPLENPSASWKYFPLLPPRLPHKHTQTHPHTWWMEWVQKVFLNSGSDIFFSQTNLEGKLGKLSKANVAGARGMSAKNS